MQGDVRRRLMQLALQATAGDVPQRDGGACPVLGEWLSWASAGVAQRRLASRLGAETSEHPRRGVKRGVRQARHVRAQGSGHLRELEQADDARTPRVTAHHQTMRWRRRVTATATATAKNIAVAAHPGLLSGGTSTSRRSNPPAIVA
jgi:hypothetical protein